MATLLTAASNGNGTSKKMVDHAFGNIAKRFSYSVYVWTDSTFDNATVKLQGSPDDTKWFDIPNASWTADATTNIEFYGTYLRGTVDSGSGSESINLVII